MPQPGDGGCFGTWATEGSGLPCFDLRGEAVREDVWHAVGNDRVTATAHGDGSIQLYWAEEGLIRLCEPMPFAPPSRLETRFGFGSAEWRRRDPALVVRRRLWAPCGELPGWRLDVTLEGRLPASWRECWRFAPWPIVLGGLLSRRIPAPASASLRERLVWHGIFTVTGASRALTEGLRALLARRLGLVPRFEPALRAIRLEPPGGARPPSRRPSWLARLPGVVFVAALGERPVTPRTSRSGRRADVSLELALPAGEKAEISFALGVCAPEALRETIEALGAAEPEAHAAAWRRTWRLDLPARPALERESAWHAMSLRSAQVRDTVLGHRYLPQGSAYSFLHGLQGAPRDYAIASIPLALIDPAGAREMLRLVLRLQRRDGAIHYAHMGAGRRTSAAIHAAPSDLPLFLLWAVTDYVLASGDRAFLEEARPALLRAWRHTQNGVGLGAHGLLRAGSGDWNDPIAAFAPRRRAFHRDGESVFNSAMAAYVLPRAAELLPEVSGELVAWATRLRAAVDATWTGRWFLRGFDGRGGPIGREHLFLDANAWCLIARIGSEERRRSLVETIATRCDDPSPIGPTILDRPHPVRGGILPPGWDTNGGVWAAISGLLAWGYALHDPARAWRCLEKQTLAAHARAYPEVWYGVWSGPDCYNSVLGERPGETFVQPATPMREFPVMNSNAHAGVLLALLKVLGVEATPGGLCVERPAPAGAGAWRLRTPLGELAGGGDQAAEAR